MLNCNCGTGIENTIARVLPVTEALEVTDLIKKHRTFREPQRTN